MIRVDDLIFAYTGAEKPAIRNLSFAIEIGEVFGFLGPSSTGFDDLLLASLVGDHEGQILETLRFA